MSLDNRQEKKMAEQVNKPLHASIETGLFDVLFGFHTKA